MTGSFRTEHVTNISNNPWTHEFDIVNFDDVNHERVIHEFQSLSGHETSTMVVTMTGQTNLHFFVTRLDHYATVYTVSPQTERVPFSHRKNPARLRLLARIFELKRTPENERWPDATWPSEQAFLDAEKFIDALPIASIPIPDIGLAHDGEVNFLWKHNGIHIDLGFYGTGAYSYFARNKNGDKLGSESVLASRGLPAEVLAWFADGSIDVASS